MNLSDLQTAFKPLIELSHRERKINLAGVNIVLRTITPKEESEIQKSLPSLNGGEETSPVEFVDIFRKETLSRSIVQIEDLDLRSIQYLETGEEKNGVKVKITKIEAVSRVIDTWSRAIVMNAFNEFTELLEEQENLLKSKLDFTPDNKDAEKEILKSRIEEIERIQGVNSVVSKHSEVTKELSKIEDSTYVEALKAMGS